MELHCPECDTTVQIDREVSNIDPARQVAIRCPCGRYLRPDLSDAGQREKLWFYRSVLMVAESETHDSSDSEIQSSSESANFSVS